MSLRLQLQALQKQLANLDRERGRLVKEIERLQNQLVQEDRVKPPILSSPKKSMTPQEKVALFKSIFIAREDVYAKPFEGNGTYKGGYTPVCVNEWVLGVCQKKEIKCSQCHFRQYEAVTDFIVELHLRGEDRRGKPFTLGTYPLMKDDHCRFLVVDFDGEQYREDTKSFVEVCSESGFPVYVERSRSGNGAHVWFFFTHPVPAAVARRMASHLLTKTMERNPELGFDSYDRLIPNQDTLPKGGLGNLIALPLQKQPRKQGNSVFVDSDFHPYPDQWAFLSQIKRIAPELIAAFLENCEPVIDATGVSREAFEDADDEVQFKIEKKNVPKLSARVQSLTIELSNQIYFVKEELSPELHTALTRLVSFHNSDFYQAQAYRLSTRNKPRIICCATDTRERLGLGRGVWDRVQALLKENEIQYHVVDLRLQEFSRPYRFQGVLRPKQEEAVKRLMAHDCGILHATTAFGKTVTAINMIAQRQLKTLILVDRQPLLKQWKLRLQEFLGLDDSEVGLIGAGRRRPNGVLDVATFQSLIHKGVIDPLIQQYGFVIVDECHHVAAFTYESLLKQCRCRYFLGLSATLHRKDGHHPIIAMQCGPVRCKVSAKQAKLEQLFVHQVFIRHCKSAGIIQEDLKMHEIYERIQKNDVRNRQILADVLKSLASGRHPVVITERKEHLEVLRELFADVPNVFVLRGGMGRKQLAQVQEAYFSVPSNESKLLLATGRFLGEGFDDPQLDTLFLTMPISWRGTLAQYAGRLHRLFDQKLSVQIYDYVDEDFLTTKRMFEKRLKGYRQIGYQVTNEVDSTLF